MKYIGSMDYETGKRIARERERCYIELINEAFEIEDRRERTNVLDEILEMRFGK